MKTLTGSLIALVACLGAVTVGCGSKATDTGSTSADASENADSAEVGASSSQTSRFDEMLYAPVAGQDPEAAAGSVVAAQWWPAGCASRARDATNKSVVKVTLNDCSGPFGLAHHTGEITVTFSKNADGSLHAQAAGSNMTVNGKAVTYSADADITVNGATRTVKFNGAWTRESAKGETISHTRTGTSVIDTSTKCRDTNGSSVTKVGAREVDSAMKDYKTCRKADGSDACPTGEIIHSHKLSGKSITVEFDGSAQAKVTGPKGNSIELPLVCTP